FELSPAAHWMRADFSFDLVAVCAGDDGENHERCTYPDCSTWFPGIHEPRRCRPSQDHAARYFRKVSALRHGSRRGTPLGAGLRWHRERSAKLVRGTWWIRARHGLQSHTVLQCDAWHGDGYAPDIRLRAAREFVRFRLERWFQRRRVLGRWLRRWWRERILKEKGPA